MSTPISADELLGFKTLRLTKPPEIMVSECRIEAVLDCETICPKCSQREFLKRNGKASQLVVWDVPHMGRPTRIYVDRGRFTCRLCQESFSDRGPEIHPKRHLTQRLAAEIISLSLRRPITRIHKEVGPSEVIIRKLIEDLFEAGEAMDHLPDPSREGDPRATRPTGWRRRIPTPEVLAIDDVKMNDDQWFTVMSHGDEGYVLAIAPGWQAKGVGRVIDAFIDAGRVKTLVTDLAGTNIALGNSTFRHAVHVADKWHVLKKFQVYQSKMINRQIAEWRLVGKGDEAATLRRLKAELEGKYAGERARRRKECVEGSQPWSELLPPRRIEELDLVPKMVFVIQHPRIRQLLHARLLLRRMYRANDAVTAMLILEEFFDRLLHPAIVPLTNPAAAVGEQKHIAALTKERDQLIESMRAAVEPIVAYFGAKRRYFDNRFRGPTTSPAESRNAKIKELWREARGLQNLAHIRLRLMYQGLRLGTDFVICRERGLTCLQVEGPFPRRMAMERSRLPVDHRDVHCCSACKALAGRAAPKTPPPLQAAA